MSNRMSVLSRRLERFAVFFSVATFASLLLGLFGNANNKSQLVYLSAGLVLVCLLATFILWLAHGFAWAMIPEKPAATKKSAEAIRQAAEMRLEEAIKPVESIRPADEMRPAAEMRFGEAKRHAEAKRPAPAETLKPVEEKKPAEALKPAEEKEPAEAMKPAEEKVVASVEEDPPDAKYTITGKRIY